MANSPAICTSFKVELMKGNHALGTSTASGRSPAKDAFKAALILASASLGAGTADYDAVTASEVSGTNYNAGGVSVTNSTEPTSSGTIAHWTPSAALVYPTVTLTTAFDAVLFYNNSQGNAAVAVFTFGSQTITAGTFTLTMPTNDGTTGLIRLN